MGGVVIALLGLAAAIIAAWYFAVRALRGMSRRDRRDGTGRRNPTSIRKN